MSSQYTNINDISYNETYIDYLGLGPYYLIDYEKPSDNTGTNLTVRINYAKQIPSQGINDIDNTQCNVNLFVYAISKKI